MHVFMHVCVRLAPNCLSPSAMECPTDTYSGPGAAECVPKESCPAGYACPAGTTVLTPCTPGRFSDVGALECSKCPPETPYSRAGDGWMEAPCLCPCPHPRACAPRRFEFLDAPPPPNPHPCPRHAGAKQGECEACPAGSCLDGSHGMDLCFGSLSGDEVSVGAPIDIKCPVTMDCPVEHACAQGTNYAVRPSTLSGVPATPALASSHTQAPFPK
jgi:hypothetical protein